jgi:hypothetical protein
LLFLPDGGHFFVAGPLFTGPEAGDHGGHLGPVRAVDIAEPGDQVALSSAASRPVLIFSGMTPRYGPPAPAAIGKTTYIRTPPEPSSARPS